MSLSHPVTWIQIASKSPQGRGMGGSPGRHCLRTAGKFNGTLRRISRAGTLPPAATAGWRAGDARSRDSSPPGARGPPQRPHRADREARQPARPLGTRPGRRAPLGWATSEPRPSSALRPATRLRAGAAAGRLRQAERGRRHGARAAWRRRARRAGASLARLARRRPSGLGRLAERGLGRAPRSVRGGRAAGGGQRGEDGRPHPEAVLPRPGEAAHQLHSAGPREVRRRRRAPAGPAPAPAPAPARRGAALLHCGRRLPCARSGIGPRVLDAPGVGVVGPARLGERTPGRGWAWGRSVPTGACGA